MFHGRLTVLFRMLRGRQLRYALVPAATRTSVGVVMSKSKSDVGVTAFSDGSAAQFELSATADASFISSSAAQPVTLRIKRKFYFQNFFFSFFLVRRVSFFKRSGIAEKGLASVDFGDILSKR